MLLRSLPPEKRRSRDINHIMNELETLRDDIDPPPEIPPDDLKPSYLELINILLECFLSVMAAIIFIFFIVCLIIA